MVPIKLKVKTFPTDPIQVANIFQVLARQLDTRFALLFKTVHSKLEEETANEHDDDLRMFLNLLLFIQTSLFIQYFLD